MSNLSATEKLWFQYPEKVLNNPAHRAWRHSDKRFCVVPSGRRSYKSVQAKRKLIRGDLNHDGATTNIGIYIYAAPTIKQVKRIAFKDLCDMTRPFWSKKPNLTDMEIFLINGSQIWCVGMDAPERIEGINGLKGCVFDEIANMKEDVWNYHIQPMGIDTNAWFDFIGVPEGKNHYYDLALKGMNNEPNWGFYSWKTSEIVDEERIIEAKRGMPDRAFRQEYEASFEDTYGIVYYAYSNDNNTNVTFKPGLKTYLCFDFNISPMSCVVVQENNEKYYCVKEFVYNNNTEGHGLDVKEWLIENNFNGDLELTGDYTGTAHKTSASADYTDWSILRSIFKNFNNYQERHIPCERQKTRTNALNALFKNALGEIKMYVNRIECPYLHKDLTQVQWKQGGSSIDKGYWLSDVSDALSYYGMNYHNIVGRAYTVN